MKVSKPILVVLVFAILFAGYMFLFTGKKQPPALPAPVAGITETGSQNPQSARVGEAPKPDVSGMNLTWREDPFFLPKSVTEKKTEKQKVVPKLVAIMESTAGRYAIVGGEVVKKGDMVGDERVAEIGKDKVILVRNNAKRILSIEDTGQ